MIHEDITKRITIARGKIGDARVQRELRVMRWGDRFCKGALGLGLVLIGTVLIRWIGQ